MSANHSTRADEPTDKREATAGQATGQESGQETGRVLRFEPRRGRPRASLPPVAAPRHGRSPVASVARYARRGDDGEDYRYRMRANLAAIVVVGLLIWCGYWLFDTLAEMRKNQDCVLSGRTNCMHIEVPPSTR
jgi:hypothetical protein